MKMIIANVLFYFKEYFFRESIIDDDDVFDFLRLPVSEEEAKNSKNNGWGILLAGLLIDDLVSI
jgi:hypothetical protein